MAWRYGRRLRSVNAATPQSHGARQSCGTVFREIPNSAHKGAVISRHHCAKRASTTSGHRKPLNNDRSATSQNRSGALPCLRDHRTLMAARDRTRRSAGCIMSPLDDLDCEHRRHDSIIAVAQISIVRYFEPNAADSSRDHHCRHVTAAVWRSSTLNNRRDSSGCVRSVDGVLHTFRFPSRMDRNSRSAYAHLRTGCWRLSRRRWARERFAECPDFRK